VEKEQPAPPRRPRARAELSATAGVRFAAILTVSSAEPPSTMITSLMSPRTAAPVSASRQAGKRAAALSVGTTIEIFAGALTARLNDASAA